MNWVDYAVLGILGLFLLYGFTRGFVRQILGIIGILGGLYLAWTLAPQLEQIDFFKGMREQNSSLPWVVSFIVIFIGVAAVSGIIIALIWRAFPKRELRGTDSLLGAFLGALEGVLILGGISIALLDWNDKKAEAVHQSVLAPRFAKGCQALVSLIPQKEQDELQQGAVKTKEEVEKAFPPEGQNQPPKKVPKVRTHADPGKNGEVPTQEPAPEPEPAQPTPPRG